MTEPDTPIETHPPVPDVAPMPAKPERWYPSVVAALLGGLTLLTLALLDTGDKLSGWLEALYVVPALLFAAAATQMVRNARASGRA